MHHRLVLLFAALSLLSLLPPAGAAAQDLQPLEIASKSGVHVFGVEMAVTPEQQAKGLMFRRELPEKQGMLFDFHREQPTAFWMKNTYIPLDMIFMDEARRVVFVEENAEPLTLQERGPDASSQYVLEVPGGWARAHGVEPGVAAKFLNVD